MQKRKIFSTSDDVGLKESVSNTLKKAGVVPNKDKEYDAKSFLLRQLMEIKLELLFSLVAREDKDKVIRFTMERKDKSGESESQVSKSGSLYTKIITDLNPRKNYLLYEVFPDSFGVYMAARDLANQAKFRLAGNPPTVGMIGGVMTGAIVPWAGRNILHRGLNHLPSLARENRLLEKTGKCFGLAGEKLIL